MEEDEPMAPGLLEPKTKDWVPPEVRPTDLTEDFPPASGPLLRPRETKYDKDRRIWIILLIGYLIVWSVITVVLIVTRSAETQTLLALVAVFVTPIINLVSIGVGYYFGKNSSG